CLRFGDRAAGADAALWRRSVSRRANGRAFDTLPGRTRARIESRGRISVFSVVPVDTAQRSLAQTGGLTCPDILRRLAPVLCAMEVCAESRSVCRIIGQRREQQLAGTVR